MEIRRHRWPVLAAALMSVALLALAGCGSSSEPSADPESSPQTTAEPSSAETGADPVSDSVAEAQAAVAAAREAPSEFVPPGPPFDVSSAKGKTVYVITILASVPFIVDLNNGIKDGLGVADVKTVVLDGQVNPTRYAQFLERAIAEKADLVITQTLPSAILAEPLAKVKAAGIPVIQMFETDPGPITDEMRARGIVAQVTECTACAGRLMADWAIADSNANVTGVGFRQSSITFADVEQAALQDRLADGCPGCSVRWVDAVTATKWATTVPSLTNNILSDAEVNYLFPLYDGMATFVVPSLRAKDAVGRVKIVTYNANRDVIALVKSGEVAADLGESASWLGWAAADQALRVLTGNPPIDDYKVPQRLFDATNIDTIDVEAPQETWYGVDFKAGFQSLWTQ